MIPTHLRLDKVFPKMLKYAEREFNQWFLSVLKAVSANGKLAEAVLKQCSNARWFRLCLLWYLYLSMYSYDFWCIY